MNSITSLSPQQLRKAAGLKEKIQALEKELNQLLGSTAKLAVTPAAAPKKRTMSAAAKAKISAAAKARWAKIKGKKSPAKPASKGRSKMSAAAKAKLSAKLKEIWARRKASKKSGGLK